MKIRNLTPHPIRIHTTKSGIITVSPDGVVVRCEQTRIERPSLHGIPITESAIGDPVDLPEMQPDTILIVSALVMTRCKYRPDVFAPGEGVRDSNGQIIGCRGLSCTPAYRIDF